MYIYCAAYPCALVTGIVAWKYVLLYVSVGPTQCALQLGWDVLGEPVSKRMHFIEQLRAGPASVTANTWVVAFASHGVEM